MKRIAVLAIGALITGTFTLAQAQHDHGSMGTGHGKQMDAEHGHTMSQMHGGVSTMTKAHHFEVVYLADGIRVYTYDGDQNPVSAEGVSGQVTITYDTKDLKPYKLLLEYVPEEEMNMGHMKMTAADYLFAPVDLSKAEVDDFRAKFEIEGMASKVEPEVEFFKAFTGLTDMPYMCPMHADVWSASADSECPLCGMKTSMQRSEMMGMKKAGNMDHDHPASHGHGQ